MRRYHAMSAAQAVKHTAAELFLAKIKPAQFIQLTVVLVLNFARYNISKNLDLVIKCKMQICYRAALINDMIEEALYEA